MKTKHLIGITIYNLKSDALYFLFRTTKNQFSMFIVKNNLHAILDLTVADFFVIHASVEDNQNIMHAYDI